MSKNRNCLQGWKCPYDNTLLVEKNLCPQRLKKSTCGKKKYEWNWIGNEPLGLKGICTQM